MPKKATSDITVLHIAGTDQIKILIPQQTRFRFGVMASKTRYFLATSQVQDFMLKQSPRIFAEWLQGQKALEQLSHRSRQHVLGLEEARNILNLIVGATLHWSELGDRWEHTKSILENAAHMAHLELSPLNTLDSVTRKKARGAVKCYEQIREAIGPEPQHFPVFQLYLWWQQLRRSRSQNLDVIALKRKLDIGCKPFRLALKKPA